MLFTFDRIIRHRRLRRRYAGRTCGWFGRLRRRLVMLELGCLRRSELRLLRLLRRLGELGMLILSMWLRRLIMMERSLRMLRKGRWLMLICLLL